MYVVGSAFHTYPYKISVTDVILLNNLKETSFLKVSQG